MTVGIAVLARNSAGDLPLALGPFVGKVDEVAILMGGVSTDNTREVALSFGQVADYAGPVDENGGLFDFGLARQQSFDMLSTEWVLMIDTDDRWANGDKLSEVIADAEAFQGVLFPYDLGASVFLQTRLFRRKCGYWSSPVHERWNYYDEPDVKTLSVNAMRVRQEKSLEGRKAGIERNIRIAEAHLKTRLDFRLLMHISNEYVLTGQYDKALEATGRILDNLGLAQERDKTPDKLFQICYNRSVAYLCLDKFEQAAGMALRALSHANYGHGWTLLAEIAYQMGVYPLVIEAADKAVLLGRPLETMPTPYANVSYAPLHLKAKALAKSGRQVEAIATLELGLKLGGGEDMADLRFRLCQEMGVIP